MGSTLHLKCGPGNYISDISFASYGLPTGTCGAYQLGQCHRTTTLATMKKECLRKSSCSIQVDQTKFGNPCNSQEKRLLVTATCSASCGFEICKPKYTHNGMDTFIEKLSPYTLSKSGCKCNGKDCACCKNGGTVCQVGRQDICVKHDTEWHDGIEQEISINPLPNIWASELPKWETVNSASYTRSANNELVISLPQTNSPSGITRINIPVQKYVQYCFDVKGRSIGTQAKIWVSKGNSYGSSLPMSNAEIGTSSKCFYTSGSSQVSIRIVALSSKTGDKIIIQSAVLRKESERFVRRSKGRSGQTRIDSAQISMLPLTHIFEHSGNNGCSPHATHKVLASSALSIEACRLFDNGASDRHSEWSSGKNDHAVYVGYDFSSPVKVTEYSFQASSCCPETLKHTPIRWIVEASVNPYESEANTWVAIDNSHANVKEQSWILGESRMFYLPENNEYRAFRIKFLETFAGETYDFHLSQVQFYTRTSSDCAPPMTWIRQQLPSWVLSESFSDFMVQTTFDGQIMSKSIGKMRDITGDTGFFSDSGKNGMCWKLKNIEDSNGLNYDQEEFSMQISYGNKNGFCGFGGSSTNSIWHSNSNDDQYLEYSFFTIPSKKQCEFNRIKSTDQNELKTRSFKLAFRKGTHECSILNNNDNGKSFFSCDTADTCFSACEENPTCKQVTYNKDSSTCRLFNKAHSSYQYSTKHVSAQCSSNTIIPAENEEAIDEGLKHATIAKFGNGKDKIEISLNPIGQIQASVANDESIRIGHKNKCVFTQQYADHLLRTIGESKCMEACQLSKDSSTRCIESLGKRHHGGGFERGTEIMEGLLPFGELESDWNSCLNTCEKDLQCKQVTYDKVNQNCYRMTKTYMHDDTIYTSTDVDYNSAVCGTKQCSKRSIFRFS
jgi:hypothetical protein